MWRLLLCLPLLAGATFVQDIPGDQTALQIDAEGLHCYRMTATGVCNGTTGESELSNEECRVFPDTLTWVPPSECTDDSPIESLDHFSLYETTEPGRPAVPQSFVLRSIGETQPDMASTVTFGAPDETANGSLENNPISSFDYGSGSNRIAGVIVIYENDGETTSQVNSITVGGVSLSREVFDFEDETNSSTFRESAEIWTTDSPPTGSQTGTVTLASAIGKDIVIIPFVATEVTGVQSTHSASPASGVCRITMTPDSADNPMVAVNAANLEATIINGLADEGWSNVNTDLIDSGTSAIRYQYGWDTWPESSQTWDWVTNSPDDYHVSVAIEFINGAGGGTTVNASLESLEVDTHAATVLKGTTVSAALESLDLTTFGATVTLGASIAAVLESMTVQEHAATLTLSKAVSAALFQAQLSTFGATTALSKDVQAELVSLQMDGQAATVELSRAITAAVEQILQTPHTATVVTGAAIGAAHESLTLETFSAGLSLDRTISAALAELEVDENAALVTLAKSIAAAQAQMGVTEFQAAAGVTGAFINAVLHEIALETFDASLSTPVTAVIRALTGVYLEQQALTGHRVAQIDLTGFLGDK